MEAVRDAAEDVVREVGEERARERLASRARRPVGEAADERQQLLVEGEHVFPERHRPCGAGLRRGGARDVRVGLLARARAPGLGDPSPSGAGERLEARAHLGVAGRDRVRAAQGLEGPLGRAVASQLVREPEQDGQRLLPVVGQHQQVGETQALGEGRGMALELRAQDRHGLGVPPLRHELVDARRPGGTEEPVEDHGRALRIVLRGAPRRRHERSVADPGRLAVGCPARSGRPRGPPPRAPGGPPRPGERRRRRGRPTRLAASLTRMRSPTPVSETATRGVQ